MGTNKKLFISEIQYLLFVWIVNLAGWVLWQKCIEYVFSDSSASLSYGMLCGWWGALYCGLLLRAYSWVALFVSFLFTLTLLAILMLLGNPLIPVHDLSEKMIDIMVYAGLHSFVISSPIIVNTVTKGVITKGVRVVSTKVN